ncbi:MAG: hypothetical protein ACI4PF_06695 [Christensenellales bacterium]
MEEKEFKNRLTDFESEVNQEIVGGTLGKTIKVLDDNTKAFKKRKFNNETLGKTPKDSQFFAELFRRLKTGKSSYCTYLNDLVSKDKYIPQYVYCFIKEIRQYSGSMAVYGEVVSPRLADLLGVSTVYNSVLEQENNDGPYDYTEYTKTLSVDFVPYGYRFMDLEEGGIDFDADTPLSSCIYKISILLQKISKKQKLNLSEENIKKTKEEFVRQFLFRNLLCEDLDFSAKNLGLLINENGDFRLAPQFDLEYMFAGSRSSKFHKEVTSETITYCAKYFPEVLNDFMSKLKKSLNNGTLKNVLQNTLKELPYYSTEAGKIIDRNSKNIFDACQNLNNPERTL